MSFTPCYVWPNLAFPFRVFYSDQKVRIFIIENLGHNYGWLKKIQNRIKDNDYFFVILGCYYHEQLVDEANQMITDLGLRKQQFKIMYNDQRDKNLFESVGFEGEIINHNAWLDENKFMKPLELQKKYDAIYVARLIELKRHYLAAEVSNLALVAGENHGTAASAYIPPHIYRNDTELSPSEVAVKINESVCGLILSEVEGASFVSSEYLMCGIPVVSTVSLGGRDIWYDDYNSIVVQPNSKDVAEAVNFLKNNRRDPNQIRSRHIELAKEQRRKFINIFSEILNSTGVDYINPEGYFISNFYHKMRFSYTVHLDEVFQHFYN